jgi:hypothetical protein
MAVPAADLTAVPDATRYVAPQSGIFRHAPAPTLGDRFEALADAWRRENSHVSSPTRATAAPSYRAIVALGPAVVPVLIRAIQAKPYENWHSALCELTKTNPVPRSQAGNIAAIAQAWKQWWEDHRHTFPALF